MQPIAALVTQPKPRTKESSFCPLSHPPHSLCRSVFKTYPKPTHFITAVLARAIVSISSRTWVIEIGTSLASLVLPLTSRHLFAHLRLKLSGGSQNESQSLHRRLFPDVLRPRVPLLSSATATLASLLFLERLGVFLPQGLCLGRSLCLKHPSWLISFKSQFTRLAGTTVADLHFPPSHHSTRGPLNTASCPQVTFRPTVYSLVSLVMSVPQLECQLHGGGHHALLFISIFPLPRLKPGTQ